MPRHYECKEVNKAVRQLTVVKIQGLLNIIIVFNVR